MRILIIEDELNNAERLKRPILEIDYNYEIIGILPSNEAVRDYFEHAGPTDLILADIQLGDGLSFESLRLAHASIPIIFTTAYDQFAVQAFKFNSIDYLLKPINTDELRNALNKVKPDRDTNPPITTDALNQLLASVKHPPMRYRERFLISRHGDEQIVVSVESVSMIGISDELVCIYTISGDSYPINMTLDVLEKQLDPRCFMRVNRQYIVHASDVSKLSLLFMGKIRVHMKSYPSLEITVSKEKASSVKKWLGS